ncbi:MAG: GH92 family glycosyl hydrolase [Prevotella sp.]|jgi:predicted alpha-1,2-mannosidase
MSNLRLSLIILLFSPLLSFSQNWQDVDPLIGSEGDGRVFIGPTAPFGMVKPCPDAVSMPNAGWSPMPEPIKGFSQTHVSGTGGGQKYGNILIQPYLSNDRERKQPLLLPDGTTTSLPLILQRREREDVSLGIYTCEFENGIDVKLTATDRSATYLISYPSQAWSVPNGARLLIDAASFLGMDTIPNKREAQQFVSSSLSIVNDHTLQGQSTVRGGWNNGDPYTVYFYMETDCPFNILNSNNHFAQVAFPSTEGTALTLRVGISFVSTQQARNNISHDSFEKQLTDLRKQWDEMLNRVDYQGGSRNRRIFRTALYHTLLMPVNRSGENPKWQGGPYYDDFYAIWDTYRTSFPLLMEYYPERAIDMVNALLAIYEHEGYLPDARSGDCNGRTQGGSNAEIVLAEAAARNFPGINYELALKAMLKDAEVPPLDDEKEGRGGLKDYIQLGYVPYGVPRAGTRTVEYSYDDWCIAQVAKKLGKQKLYRKYMKRSENWKNLWRSDYEWQGMRGFIMPRSRDGQWLDSVTWGKSTVRKPKIAYRPDTKVAPWYIAWWDTFFYEALSAEYSLSIPHDVPSLISLCGGPEAFRQRLDTFFDNGHYNVGNEPSFLTPYLYHYIGRPDLSSQRVKSIVLRYFSDSPDGLPGNDDSGAMSAWLVWAMLGRYPVAGQGKYLEITPVVFPEPASGIVHFTLNRQYRSWPVAWQWRGDTLHMKCNNATYLISRETVQAGRSFCWNSPQKDSPTYHCQGTFLFLSQQAYDDACQKGSCSYDGLTWRVLNKETDTLHLQADIEGTEMWVKSVAGLPLIVKSTGSPLNIDWTISLQSDEKIHNDKKE